MTTKKAYRVAERKALPATHQGQSKRNRVAVARSGSVDDQILQMEHAFVREIRAAFYDRHEPAEKIRHIMINGQRIGERRSMEWIQKVIRYRIHTHIEPDISYTTGRQPAAAVFGS